MCRKPPVVAFTSPFAQVTAADEPLLFCASCVPVLLSAITDAVIETQRDIGLYKADVETPWDERK